MSANGRSKFGRQALFCRSRWRPNFVALAIRAMHSSRSAEIAATVSDPAPVLQLIVVSAVEILQGAAGVIALMENDRLVPRASYGLPSGALASLHPRLDRVILSVLGQVGEQVSVLYLPSGFGDWARRYHVLALPMQQRDQL